MASPTSANVSWNNPAGTIQGIQIWQSRNDAGYVEGENVPVDRTTAVRTGLDPGARYCFKVRVQMEGYWSDLSASAPCVTLPEAVPTGVVATPVTLTTARVAWNNPAGTIEAIQIYQSANGGAYAFAENVPPDRTSAVRDQLTPGSRYCYQVRVQVGGQWRPFSAPACATQGTVSPPTGVAATALTTTSARVSWNNPAVAIEGIKIHQSVNGGAFAFAENVPIDRTSAIRDGLTPETPYCFKVQIQNSGVWSELSSPAACITTLAPFKPTVSAHATSPTKVQVAWNVPAQGTIEAIQIYQSKNGGAFEFGENVPVDRTSAIRDGLDAGASYCFKVRMQVGGLMGPFSDPDCASTPLPPPPTGVRATTLDSGSAEIAWQNPAGTIQAIQIYQSRDGGSYVFGENVPPDREKAVRDGLTAHATYCFKVRVQMDGQWSPFSDPPACTVMDPPPARAPTGVTATLLTSTSARVSWNNPPGVIQAIQIYQSLSGGRYEFGENVPPDRESAIRDNLVAGASYCFRVRAQIGGVWSGLSDTSACINCQTPLNAPALTAPPNEAENVGRTVALGFSAVTGADDYEYRILRNGVLVLSGKGNSGVAVTLPQDGEYQWQVRAIGCQANGPWSATLTFSTTPRLTAPVLVYPVDLATIASSSVALQWQPVSGAASYEYEIRQGNAPFKTGSSAGATRVVVRISDGSAFSWRVRAKAARFAGPWSAWRTFNAANTSQLVLLSQPLLQQGQGIIRFNWPATSGNSYWLQYKNNLNDSAWSDLRQINSGAFRVSIDEFVGTNNTGFFRVAQREGLHILPSGTDADHDGMPDAWETAHGLNPLDPADALADPDNDGLNNADEYELGSNLNSPENAGSIPGQFAVSSAGAGTYVIPIGLPPGTAGMAPKISLAYSSRSGNGLLGMGWAIAGLSAVTRCSPTLAQDGFRGGIEFDDDDRFCLDGQRLILVNAVYGADGSEYRTEIDTFTRVVAVGRTGNGPTGFRACSKGGQIIEYGLREDSRVEAQGKPTVMVWLANKITDTSGNYIRFYYTKNTATGEYMPARIEYTGNEAAGLSPYATILFNYETRPDKSISYQAGSVVRSNFRVASIETYAEGSLVHRYSFAYEQGLATGRSRLKTVTLTDANGLALPATTCVSWSDQQSRGRFSIRPAFSPSGYHLGANNYRYGAGDVNGDGVADMIHFAGADGVRVWLSKRDGTFDIKPSFPNNGYNVAANGYKFLSGDFNGDGKDDLIHLVSPDYAHVWLSRGDGTYSIRPRFPDNDYDLSANNYNIQTGDFDGDGRTDLIHLVSPSEVRVFLSNGDGTFRIGPSWNPGYDISYNNYKVFIIDADGDGRSDVLHFANDTFVRIWLSNGDGMFRKLDRFPETDDYALSQNAYAFTTGDFNGDGKTDLIHFVDRDSVRVWLNKGDGTFSIRREFNSGSGYSISDNNYNFKLGDFNGDGKTDLIHFADPDGVRVWSSKGDGTFTIEDAFPKNGYAVSANGYKFLIGNFSSDSKTDMIHLVNDSTAHVWNAGGPLPDQLTVIVDGYGHTNRITYKPLTDPTVYTKGTGATYPQSEMQGPIYVVAAHAMGDGLGGDAVTTYTYGGARMDQDRGFLGFRWQRSVEERTGIQQYTESRQDYPFIGSLSFSETRTADNRLVSRATNTYAVSPSFGWSVSFPFVWQSVAESYELDGRLVSRITTSSQYDAFGNPTVVDVTADDGYRKVTTSTFANDTTRWILGKITRAQVTAYAPGQAAQPRTSGFDYTPSNGLLLREQVEPGSPLAQSTEYARDNFGNATVTTASGPGVAPRTSRITYDAQGRFPVIIENALGHRETREYDPRFGGVTEVVTPNGQITRAFYDGFGRKRREVRPDGVTSRVLIALPDANAPPLARTRVVTKTTGSAPGTAYMDELGRTIRTVCAGFDGRPVLRDVIYNLRGFQDRTSRPYFPGDPVYWFVKAYDDLGRVIQVTNPDSSRGRTEYHGLTTIVFNELNQRRTTVKNSQGWLLQGTDDAGNVVTHTYDSFGNLLTSTDPAGNVIASTYDLRGRKLTMTDPDAGFSELRYNAFSEVVWRRDAKNQQFTSEYDILGRITRQVIPEGQVNYFYDAGANGIGQLYCVTSYNGYQRFHTYDTLSRPDAVMTVVNGEVFTVRNHYDVLGRVDQITYPTGYAVRQVFNGLGYLAEVRSAADNTLLWRADTVNAEGLTVHQTLGNGLTTVREYDPARQWIRGIRTGLNNGTEVQNLSFSFDPLGNLTVRTDDSRGLAETFGYDNLNRLTTAEVRNGTFKSYSYDAIGNITFKSDVGIYQYDRIGAGPHAVTHAGSMVGRYTYDANGNMLGGNLRSFGYYSFNKPGAIVGAGASSEFTYDSEHNRLTHTSESGGETSLTVYVGGLYERVSSASRVEHRHFISAGGAVVAIHSISSTEGTQTRYVHKDHLGSVQAITGSSGNLVERFSYDPHGKRRGDNWEDVPSGSRTSHFTERGFGGHVQLDALELVHMGGRVYDPVLGRFTSPDPFVQSMSAVQAFNRYTYVMNNPLSMIDPTGFRWGNPFKKAKQIVHSISDTLGVAGDVLTGGMLSVNEFLVDHPQVTGIIVGAVVTVATANPALGAAASGFISSEGDLKAAVTSAATTYAFGVIDSQLFDSKTFADVFSRTIAHGLVGGASAEIQGGKFSRGFALAAAVQGTIEASTSLYDQLVNYDADWHPGGGAVLQPNDMPPPVQGANNIGLVCTSQGPPCGFWSEGGPVSVLLNGVPGINATSGMHDQIMNLYEQYVQRPYGIPFWAINVPTMPVAALLTYPALINNNSFVQGALTETLMRQ